MFSYGKISIGSYWFQIENREFIDKSEFANGNPLEICGKFCYQDELPASAYPNEFFIVSNRNNHSSMGAYQGQGTGKTLKIWTNNNCPFFKMHQSFDGTGTKKTYYILENDKLFSYYINFLKQKAAAAAASAKQTANAIQYEWEHTLFVPHPKFIDGYLDKSSATYTDLIDVGTLFGETIKVDDFYNTEFVASLNGRPHYQLEPTSFPKVEILCLGEVTANTKPGIVADTDIDGAHVGSTWSDYPNGAPIVTGLNAGSLTSDACAGVIDPLTSKPMLRLAHKIHALSYTEYSGNDFAYEYPAGFNGHIGAWTNMTTYGAGTVFKLRKVKDGIVPLAGV